MNPITKFPSNFPYFDDYAVEKNFYKILFKPSSEIQVRELNQLQTILKEQLARFGAHVFQNGSLVYGCDHQINTSCFAFVIEFLEITPDDLFELLESKFIVNEKENKLKIAQILTLEKTSIANQWLVIVNDISNDIIQAFDICTLSFSNISGNFPLKIISRSESAIIKFNTGLIYLDGEFIHVPKQKKILSATSKKFSGSIGFEIQRQIIQSDNSDYLNVNLNLICKSLEYVATASGSLAEQEIIGNFIEFIRVDNGQLLKDVRTPIYSELEKTLARRTYDESGNYTVKPFSIKINPHDKNTDKFALEISPGKSYVLGYEFDSIGTRILDLNRALDVHQKNNFEISTYYGNYIRLENFTGFFNVQTCEKIDLLDKNLSALSFIPGGNYNSSIIGSARVRHVKYLETEIQLYLFDIQTITNKTFADVQSICASNLLASNRGMGDILGDSVIQEKETASLIFPLPEDYIKTIRDTNGKITSDYSIQKTYTGILFTPSDTPGSDENITYGIIENPPKERFITSPTNFIIVSRTDGEVFYPDSVIALDTENLFVSLQVNKPAFEADIYAIVNVNFSQEKQKQKTSKTLSISLSSLSLDEYISLETLDVIDIESITINGTASIEQFILDTYDNQDVYRASRIQFKNTSISTPVNIVITFNYFNHSGSGYFSIDSYKSRTEINDIGSKKLSKSIDFRVDYLNELTKNAYIPIPDGTFECSYSYYLSRIDKLVVTGASKTFEIIEGTSAKDPVPPKDRSDAMTIYTLSIPAYSPNPQDVIIKFHENKRYTMRDIGKLEKRIENLEYYSALSLLEKDTKDMQILDENGNNRFKNGFLIDNFKSFKSVDLASIENTCSLDEANAQLRPSFEMSNQALLYNPYDSTTRRCGDLVLMPFTPVVFIEQLKATEVINLQPYEVFTWEGTLNLFPETDEWIDTETKPDIIANQYGSTDVFEQIGEKAFTAVWGSWEKHILAIPETTNLNSVKHVTADSADLAGITSVKKLWNPSVDSHVDTNVITAYNSWTIYLKNLNDWKKNPTSTKPEPLGFYKEIPDGIINGQPAIYLDFKGKIEENKRQLSQSGFGKSEIFTSSLGESVTDVAIAPFIRAKSISVKAKNLKPNTIFYVFFDEDNVTALCNTGLELKSTDKGLLEFIFELPGGKYRNGEHLFKIIDTLEKYNIGSFANSKYIANGLKQTKQETIVSTREPTLVTKVLKEEKTQAAVANWTNNNIIVPTPTPSITPTNLPPPPSPLPEPPYYPPPTPAPSSIPGVTVTPTPQPCILNWNKTPAANSLTMIGGTITSSTPWTLNVTGSSSGKNYFTLNPKSGQAGTTDIWIDKAVTFHVFDTDTIYFTVSNNCKSITDSCPVSPYQVGRLDPIAQSFFVDPAINPEGIFLTSAEIFFKTKSSSAAVTLELRPSVNGYPSDDHIIPFSQVSLHSDDIKVSLDASLSTQFDFLSPVYLTPGEYHLVIRTQDTEYTAWIATLGHFELGSETQRVTKNPYIGVLLKSANNLTWIPDGNSDLKFRLNRCSFDVSTQYKCCLENKPYFSNETILTPKPFNSIRTNIVDLIPDKTKIDSYQSSFINANNISTIREIKFNETVELLDQFIIKDNNGVIPKILDKNLVYKEEGDDTLLYNQNYSKGSLIDKDKYFEPNIVHECILSSTKESVSPFIDLQRMSNTLVKNKINYLEDIDLESEITPDLGKAEARYVTKTVILASQTPANKLFVSFAANIPRDISASARVRVYYKVFNTLYDAASSTIKAKNWSYLNQTELKSASENDFIDFEFQTDIIEYDGNSSIIDFDQFSIKLVLESKNPSFVPKIKDLRVIALTT